MSSALFNSVAQQYDETFTNTEIGKIQRARVWNYLESILPNDSINILELNCGTGEDAIWFANKGHNVLATDISENMISITKNKIEKFDLTDKVIARILDINDINKLSATKKYDLVFSNFGGLNCLTEYELKSLSNRIKYILTPGGKFISVVMPDFCIVESIYFLFKIQIKDILRRKRVQQVKINDSIIDTYYYRPKRFYGFFKDNFDCSKRIAIGLFIPPSYLDNFFRSKTSVLNILNRLEKVFGNNTIASSISDHFLIDLNIKK